MKLSTLLFAFSLTFTPVIAFADPPVGPVFLQRPVIACDTHSQITALLDAVKNGNLPEKLDELHHQLDADGEPVCIFSPLGTINFGKSESMGTIIDHGNSVNFWIVEVSNIKSNFYIIWGNVNKEDSDKTPT